MNRLYVYILPACIRFLYYRNLNKGKNKTKKQETITETELDQIKEDITITEEPITPRSKFRLYFSIVKQLESF